MLDEIKYYCPIDKKEVLFVETPQSKDLNIIKMIVPESPKTCPKCKKSYYKYECVTKE
jgi:hypothetical protein